MTRRPSTRGNPIAGGAAALLAATRLRELVRGQTAALGSELLLDLERHTIESLHLPRNPTCRAPHLRWPLAPIDDLPLGELVARVTRDDPGGITRASGRRTDAVGPARIRPGTALRDEVLLGFPAHMFVSHVECSACDHEDSWRVVPEHDPSLEPCPRCGGARWIPGFEQRERARLDELPPSWLDRSPRDLGLRAGDLIELRFGGTVTCCELAPGGERVVSDLRQAGPPSRIALFGLGNIGSALVAQLARLPGITGVLVCDPDRYEPGQQLGQAIAAADVGRPKAAVARETIHRIAPDLEVRAFELPLEAVPIGLMRGSIVVSALDSVAARLRLADRARRVGAPFVDTGVAGGESLLARVTVFGATSDDACFECSLEPDAATDGVWPCDTAAAG